MFCSFATTDAHPWKFQNFNRHRTISTATATSSSSNVDHLHEETLNASINNKKIKSHYEIDDMEQTECNGYNNNSLLGSGREWNIFDSRGGAKSSGGDTMNEFPTLRRSTADFPSSSSSAATTATTRSGSRSSSSSRRYSSSRPSSGISFRSSNPTAGKRYNNKSILTNIKEWIQAGNLPKIQCRVEPNTTLKVRKTFRPLKTVVRLGADFNTQLGVWQFKSSWEDDVIGGKLTLAGRELQFSKTWLLSVGAVEDLVTRLRFRAAVDLGTMKAYARLGFRTERLSPINVVEGFTLRKRLPLDGNDGHVKLEVKANFAFPEPEIEYSTENHRSFVGMGDIEVNIDELNLLLDY
jgi:hypothetical protein